MTENERLFWQKILELARGQLKQALFDFYVADTRLVQFEQNTATIQVNAMQKIFWEKNLTPLILMAGFDVYGREITVSYVLEDYLQESISATYTVSTPTTAPISRPELNPKYHFDNFIQGDENRWAVAASLAVANTPGNTYNPLFIWGGPGLGKTHLLNAIGNTVWEQNHKARIKYITAENFINEFVAHIRLDNMDELKEKFRNLDLLLIDDIQSLAKKTLSGTQEEFFNTFNALHNNNKQIVLTSDRAPNQLHDLEERLVTRFGWGLTVHITPPDYETRIAILKNKMEDYPYHFPNDTIEYLASQFDSNVRDLEGSLKDISLVASIKDLTTITVDVAAEAIRARKFETPKLSIIPIDMIQEEVSKFYDVSVKDIKATKRTQDIVLARQVAMFLAREMTDNSLPKIGKEFGGRDHSTVLHAYNKIKNMIKQNDSLRIEIETIRHKLK